MKKFFVCLLILMLLFHIDSKAFIAKNIDLKLEKEEMAIVFIRLPESISLLINDKETSNLFILYYKSDKNLDKALKIFKSKPDIFFLNNDFDRKIDNVYVLKKSNLIRFRFNNYTLCIYSSNSKNVTNCDFVYLMNLDIEFIPNDKLSAIFYDDKIDKKYLKQVGESWIDNHIVSSDSFTILKLDEDTYNVMIVPSTKN